MVTTAKTELTTPTPMSLNVPAAVPSFCGSFLACSSSWVMTP